MWSIRRGVYYWQGQVMDNMDHGICFESQARVASRVVGGVTTPERFQKREKWENMGYFHAQELSKLAFTYSERFLIMVSALKSHQLQGALPPGPPPGGTAPGPPEVPLPPLTIYPGAAPDRKPLYLNHLPVISLTIASKHFTSLSKGNWVRPNPIVS